MGRRTSIPVKVIRPTEYRTTPPEAEVDEGPVRRRFSWEQPQADHGFDDKQPESQVPPQGEQTGFDAEPARDLEPRDTVEYWRDQTLRLQADMDNFRKRQQRLSQERVEANRQQMLRAFLGVVDDLERALAAPSGDTEGLRQGIELTLRSALQFLQREGVEEIPAQNQPFDPNWHEAVATVRHNDDGLIQNTNIQVTEPGYRLGDQLLRPAKVVVAV